MSLADDRSLLAMKAARMSIGSIAFTMGWTEKHVERRLGELDVRETKDRITEAVTAPRPTPTPERKPAPANPVRTPAPRPTPENRGMVTRTFALFSGGHGAAVLLPDARVVFVETGHAHPELLAAVDVEPAAGFYRLAETQARRAA